MTMRYDSISRVAYFNYTLLQKIEKNKRNITIKYLKRWIVEK